MDLKRCYKIQKEHGKNPFCAQTVLTKLTLMKLAEYKFKIISAFETHGLTNRINLGYIRFDRTSSNSIKIDTYDERVQNLYMATNKEDSPKDLRQACNAYASTVETYLSSSFKNFSIEPTYQDLRVPINIKSQPYVYAQPEGISAYCILTLKIDE